MSAFDSDASPCGTALFPAKKKTQLVQKLIAYFPERGEEIEPLTYFDSQIAEIFLHY